LIGMSGFTILLGALFLTQSHRLIRSIR
jgi:hypothetical protein